MNTDFEEFLIDLLKLSE